MSTSNVPSSVKRFRKQPLVGGQSEIAGILDAVRAGRCCRLIGPRYHHKSQIMRAACEAIDKQLGYASVYLSLWDAHVTSDAMFYASLGDLIATKIKRHYRRRLPPADLRTPAELNVYLTSLPELLKAHLVVCIDDLEAAAPDYSSELLKVLRAAYQSTASDWHLLAVVCASHSLARSALGPTSPFENISNLVVVGDFSFEETRKFARQQVENACPLPTPQALQLLHNLTGGDRTLVSEVCRECCLLSEQHGKRRITVEVVEQAIESLMQHGGREALAEGLQQIENDPDVLRSVLRLMREGRVPSRELNLDPAVRPDPLTTSGFVRLEDRQFLIKSDLHFRLLERYFTPERVGRIFLAAGDWESAIHYLGAEIRSAGRGTAEERARVMLGAVSSMYSVQGKRDAFGYLARGFETAYPHLRLRLYDYDKDRNALVRIETSPAAEQPKRVEQIAISAIHQPEVRALGSAQEFWLQPTGHHHMTLYVPLRPSPEDIQGLVAVEGFIARSDYRRKQEMMLEMVGYLRHAAHALKNRAEHERLYDDAMQRAQDLQNLLTLMRRLMNSKGSYQDILDQTLHSAVSALGPQAQMGSIYLYDRASGLLTMSAHTGYSEAVQQEARFAPGKGLAGYVYKTGRLWNVRDTEHDPRYKRLSKTPDRVRSTIGVPLHSRSGVLGVLCLDNLKHPHAFTAESERILTLFAGEVAPWLENAHLVDMLRQLHETAIELLALDSPNLHALFETVAERLLNNFNFNACAIGLREEPSTVRFVVKAGLAELPDKIEVAALPARLQQDVLTTRQFIVVDLSHAPADEWRPLLKRAELGTLIALPLCDDRGQHSLMLLASAGSPALSGEEQNLLLTFANQIALALENTRLYGQVHGELLQKIEDLQQANRRLEMMHVQEVQYRNARLATGLLHQINNAVANIPELVDEIERQSWLGSDLAPLNELKLNAVAVSQISHWLHQFVRLGNLTLEDLDLRQVIEEAQQQLESRWPAHVAPPEVHIAPGVPLLRADRALMEILFQNLLRNAYEAIPDQQPGRITIESEATSGECLIRISDNGQGVPPDQRELIWEWGFSTKRPDGVTHDRGLGLFACKQIVEGHAGTIELAETHRDEGAIFLIRLPIQGPPRDPSKGQQA